MGGGGSWEREWEMEGGGGEGRAEEKRVQKQSILTCLLQVDWGEI